MSTMPPDHDWELVQAESRVIRFGDALLWGWGEFKRLGLLDALLTASIASIRENGTIGAPGTYSDPTLARLLEAESQQAATAMMVDEEIRRWSHARETLLWANVAEKFYAAPHKRTNSEVGRMLQVSPRSVVLARHEMRRVLVVTVQASRELA